jgi:hypothetical protein
LPPIPEDFVLTLPGMGELRYLRDTIERMPRPSSMLLKFLNGAAPAMAPITNIIKLLDMIQAIVACVTAIPKSIMTINPGPIIKCFEKLFKALMALMQLMPPMPYIKMIVDIVRLIRMLIDDLLNIFGIIDGEISKIKATIDKAKLIDNPQLLEIGECARDNLTQEVGGVMQIISAIGKVLGIVFTIMDTFAVLIPSLSEKISEWQEQINGAVNVGAGGVSGFPPLRAISQALVAVRQILLFIEQFGSAILGLSFQMPEFPTLSFANP